MTQLIAEIGWNHMGDLNLAKEMVFAAKENGADYAKFQTWSVKNLKPGPGTMMEEKKFMKKLS